ncbi:hydrolase [Alkalilimnicola ehrlichii]|uniref:Hydrolase n=1 Tax=Alkalilimnicola ehrlichii TaxID=351052 RepID=A0A3E0WUY1_9GAMM|nr:hydrolase [Alkalilimnicola ehrlichii]RFA28592.1 hydrolase [Alkalilimnicola ehrlichii]RFA35757.1 hydrolase [Alkalilimnicola ehrlichii]
MLLNTEQSIVIVVDVQARLLPGVHENEKLVKNCSWLVKLAHLLKVPVLGSEQYPQGLGHTEENLRNLVGAENIVGKTHFSCIDAPEFAQRFHALKRRQVVICGMESQACVLQSALRLLEEGLSVHVAADAISARDTRDTEIALKRMEQAGVTLVTREMVGFEWIRRSDAEAFKAFSKEFLR